MAQIFIGSDHISQTIDIVARYSGSVDSKLVSLTETSTDHLAEFGINSLPTLIITENGNQVSKTVSPLEIIRSIGELSKLESNFFGKTEEHVKQIASHFDQIAELKGDELAEQLNNDLKLRMFLVSYNITAADILAYTHIAHYLHSMKDSDRDAHCNLTRWALYLQQIPGISQFAERNNLVLKINEDSLKHHKREVKKSNKTAPKEVHKEDKQSKENKGKSPKKEEIKEEKKQEDKKTKAPKEPKNDKIEEEKKDVQSQPEEAKGKKEKKPKPQNPPKEKTHKAKEEFGEPITQLDVRVGRINKVWKHPDSEKLYCEEIDIGDEKPRQIASGLQQYIPIEKMENALVIVLANLKPKKLGGFESQGMVLTANNGDHTVIELLVPPEGSLPGDKVSFKGFDRNPPKVLNPKKKIFEAVAGDLRVDENGIAKFKDAEFITEKGIVVSNGIRNGTIS